ncbi:5'-3' exonuclease [Streptomyces sp. 1331.2]|uniref:5'-3' exonuclease n=1 Tax=Streptomyces sp. 1331.2 TaxID=1938835 RepID=UPI000BC822DD|nr:5'-3' exonuclease [Streptomyces sp. 1331.2]SOB85020.1 5'-3' exonuclease, C-terminal SAM fold [Streptomyces sp. 1331.2]
MLLDSASLYFRAYYGVPDTLRSPQGEPVNAVRGLLDFIARLVHDHRPDQLVACMDADWRPQWRVDLVPSYKTHRVAEDPEAAAAGEEEVPDTLAPQVPVIEQVLDALGIARVGSPGYEADDVIGTLTARAEGPVQIVTGDRDLFQLVDDARQITVLYPVKGMGNLQVTDDALLLEKYGVRGAQYADMAALRGDPSDGLPGVKGIGEKTAAQLINEYGDIAAVRAAALDLGSRLTPARRRNIVEGAGYLDVAPTVVRVAVDAPLPAFDPALPREPLDPMTLEHLSTRWGLGTSLERVIEALATR